MSPDFTLRFRVLLVAESKGEADVISRTMGAGLSGWPGAKETHISEPVEHRRPPGRTAAPQRSVAEDWLFRYLAGAGPVPARKVIDAADAAGVSHRTLRRAADKLGVIREPKMGGSNTTWALPKEKTDA